MTPERTLQYLKEDLEENIRKYQKLIDIANEHNLNDKYYLGVRNAMTYVLRLIEIYGDVEK